MDTMDTTEMVDVLLAGTILPGADLEEAITALVNLAGITPDQARTLITCGKPRLVKRNLTPEAGGKLMDRLGAMGIKTIMRPATGSSNTLARMDAPRQRAAFPAEADAGLPQTAARPARYEPSAAEEVNPYAPPKANLVRERRSGEGEWRDVGVVVPAGHGLKWIRDAWALFRARPGAWCGAMLLYSLCIVLAGLIPVLGQLATTLLNPILCGGIALMAHDQREGEDIRATGLFRGFGPRFGQLALIGVFLLLGGFIMGIIAVLLIGGQAAFALMSGNPNPALLEPIAGRLLLFFPLFLICFAPMMLAMVFAPTLTAAGGRGAWQAMLAGVEAGLRNWKAGLVNFIGLLGFGIGLGIVFGVTTTVLGALAGRENMGVVLAVFMVLGLLLWLPAGAVLTLMGYTAARDIFYDNDEY